MHALKIIIVSSALEFYMKPLQSSSSSCILLPVYSPCVLKNLKQLFT